MRTPVHVNTYRSAACMASVATILLVWLSLGVGIIGADGDPANRMYLGVVAIGAIGVPITRLQPIGMARVLAAMAFAQALIGAFALVEGLGLPWSGPAEIVLLNGFFVALFGGSAWMFAQAALAGPGRGRV